MSSVDTASNRESATFWLQVFDDCFFYSFCCFLKHNFTTLNLLKQALSKYSFFRLICMRVGISELLFFGLEGILIQLKTRLSSKSSGPGSGKSFFSDPARIQPIQ